MSTSNLYRWSGAACMVAGVLLFLATSVHPSKETPAVILEQEYRLIAGHWLYTFFHGFFLLGLVGLYTAQSERAGRVGLVSFLMVFFGELFFVESNDYGFIAPVLAAGAPAMLDAINLYPPVATLNALVILGFFPGLSLFGIVMIRDGYFPRRAGLCLALGSPLYLVGGALGQLVNEALWSVAIFAAVLLALGLGWAGYALWSSVARQQLKTAVAT
jgi:hypothetical protein